MTEKTDWHPDMLDKADAPRRSGDERRCGKDKRFWITRRKEGERRSGEERRVLPDRRKKPR
ncbi:MAG: hypothetical protein R3D45_09125 [Rhizobiaceae bacterium]